MQIESRDEAKEGSSATQEVAATAVPGDSAPAGPESANDLVSVRYAFGPGIELIKCKLPSPEADCMVAMAQYVVCNTNQGRTS